MSLKPKEMHAKMDKNSMHQIPIEEIIG